MMIMKMMDMTLGSLVCAFLHCVLTIMLVMLVAWGLTVLYQQELISNVTFSWLLCSYEYDSISKVVNSSKCFGAQIPDFPSRFQNKFFSYSHGLTLSHSFLLLSLHQKHDSARSNWIHPPDLKPW